MPGYTNPNFRVDAEDQIPDYSNGEEIKVGGIYPAATPSDIYKDGMDRSLEILRDHLSIERIIVNAKDHSVIGHGDIDASVKSTVDYVGIARGNYRMTIVSPCDLLARSAMDFPRR